MKIKAYILLFLACLQLKAQASAALLVESNLPIMEQMSDMLGWNEDCCQQSDNDQEEDCCTDSCACCHASHHYQIKSFDLQTEQSSPLFPELVTGYKSLSNQDFLDSTFHPPNE